MAKAIPRFGETDLARTLKLDKSSISRRVGAALDGGFLKNLEDRKGRPARLVLGDPMSGDLEVLPFAERLARDHLLHGCAVDNGGNKARPFPNPASESNSAMTFSASRPERSKWEARL